LPSIQQWRRGRVARLGSAKAPTAVRIRTMPQKASWKREAFLFEAISCCSLQSFCFVTQSAVEGHFNKNKKDFHCHQGYAFV
jgi:hypothetical protein